MSTTQDEQEVCFLSHTGIGSQMNAQPGWKCMTHVCVCVCACVHTYTHTYIHTYIHTQTHVSVYIYIYVYLHVCVHIYIYTHTYTYKYTYTYTRFTHAQTCSYLHVFARYIQNGVSKIAGIGSALFLRFGFSCLVYPEGFQLTQCSAWDIYERAVCSTVLLCAR